MSSLFYVCLQQFCSTIFVYFNQPTILFMPSPINSNNQPFLYMPSTTISANHFPLSHYNQLSQLIFNSHFAKQQLKQPINFIQPFFLTYSPRCKFLVRLFVFLLQSLRGSSVEDLYRPSLVLANSATCWIVCKLSCTPNCEIQYIQ